jgi:AraC-like DNA-binding protein
MERRDGDPAEARQQLRPRETIRQEYRQPGRAPVSVRLFPADSFETVLVRPPHVGSGLQRSVLLGEGLFYVASQLSGGPEETIASGYCPEMVYFAFNLSETPLIRTLDGDRWQTRYGDSDVLSASTNMTLTYSPFCRARMLSLFVLPPVLEGLAEDQQSVASPHRIASLLRGGASPARYTSRMTPEMRAVVERTDESSFHGGLKKLYLEGKILELLALRLAQLSEAPPLQARAALSRRQIERLHEARALVTARMAAPPSLRELSREVALSTTLLKRGFRELFGVTVFEHLRNLRLERARELLRDQGASVKEAAWSVGYASLSHFARAFGARFGANPRAWAKAHVPHLMG